VTATTAPPRRSGTQDRTGGQPTTTPITAPASSAARRLTSVPAQPTSKPVPRDKLTVAEVCAELQIAQSTFYEWRTKGTAPRCIKLPNGQLRVRRIAFETWLSKREDAA
jgi:predicted DNA-binding transcriptional regulator AlpA